MSNSYGHKKHSRSVATRQTKFILIVCEGEKTEPNYFKSFKKKIENEEDFKIEIVGKAGSPIKVVEKAVELKNKNPQLYIQVWAVFDKDDFPNDTFDNAISKAREKGINVAWSNECFELWYMLHFDYHTSALNREKYIDIINKSFKKQKIHKKYSKNDEEMYEILDTRQEFAIRNATRLLYKHHKTNSKPHEKNPVTSVHLLVENLNKFKK